ncbi:hypothetical protein SAMN04488563_3423 [Jiangella alkaliphila]|jgi:hypothetical protein|uniref:Uncharacterized protein n=1 Tax=Jiangella alkaliphila TaxID=419479 RepID=A0A1H2K513_9ACTN|nr:hypothetical protein SAMN04488563_3423 [Jiangella alkaliphila]
MESTLASEQIAGGHSQRTGEPMDVQQCHVALAALDRADVGAVEVGAIGEVLLTEAQLTTELPDASAERAEGATLIVGRLGHPSTLRVAPVKIYRL